MAFTLQRYLARVSFFLRDTSQKFWSQTNLIEYINQARQDVTYDTACCRAYADFTAVPSVERYDFATYIFPAVLAKGYPAESVAYIQSVSAELNPTLRYKLNYMQFDSFDAYYRTLPYGFLPGVWTMFDYQSFYLAPVPNAAYQLHADCVWLPNPLVTNSDQEKALPTFLADIVAMKACSWAKFYERNYGEADAFNRGYTAELNKRFGLIPASRVPSYYDENPINP